MGKISITTCFCFVLPNYQTQHSNHFRRKRKISELFNFEIKAMLSLLVDDLVECVARHGGVCICKHLSLAPFAREQTSVPCEHQVKQMPGTRGNLFPQHGETFAV